jgi:hypothetical protein
VAKLLGIPSIYTNDNEHAMGNKPAFIFASSILIPENLAIEKSIDLDFLCLAASEAFDPCHTPGDPIRHSDDELWSILLDIS